MEISDKTRERVKATLEVCRDLSNRFFELSEKYHLDATQSLLIASNLSARIVRQFTDSCTNERDVQKIEEKFLADIKYLFDTKDDPIIIPDDSSPEDPIAN